MNAPTPAPRNTASAPSPAGAAEGVAGVAAHDSPVGVEIAGLRRTYPGTRKAGPIAALRGLWLSVAPGEFCVLLGPNGSGKSTLLRILSGLDFPDAGACGWTLAGSSGPPMPIDPARLGVVFQSPALDELLTVGENLRLAAGLFGLRGADAHSRIMRACSRLGLADRMDARVGTLSGGLKRRADLARALLHRPGVLLLDEPTAGLDLRARRDFLDLLHACRADDAGWRPTIIMTTHLMDEAERADRVVLMHEGRIVVEGAPGTLRTRLGGTIIRCAAPVLTGEDHAQRTAGLLRQAGVHTVVTGSGLVLGRSGDGVGLAQIESAVTTLTRAGIPFEVGPPTLGDVYLAATGKGLETDGLPPLEGRV
jgi:ABC-2 type transport system ATP-binding protein